MRATGDTLPSYAVVVLLAGAAWRLVGVAIECSPGSIQPRESLPQDSRSAVKARMFDPLRGSFGEGRCTPRKAGVSGHEGGRHVDLSPPSREETLRRCSAGAIARVRHWR